jgi:hypothetical protein
MENYDFSFPDPAVDILMALYILDADGRALAERRFTHQMPDLDDSRVPYEVTDVNSICGKFGCTQFAEVILKLPQRLPSVLVVFSPIKSEMRHRVRRCHQVSASMSVKHVVANEGGTSRLFPAVQCSAEIGRG